MQADAQERRRLKESPVPICIYNSYATMDPGGGQARADDAKACKALECTGVKFNLGSDVTNFDQDIAAAAQWGDQFPPDVRLMCECHPGTIMETPENAQRAFQRWDGARFEAMLHPLLLTTEEIARWFEYLGHRITHAHLQMRNENNIFMALAEDRRRILDTAKRMKSFGFQGTWSIEFVKGTCTKQDRTPALFDASANDLKTLRSLFEELG